jgi:hypothetical protein
VPSSGFYSYCQVAAIQQPGNTHGISVGRKRGSAPGQCHKSGVLFRLKCKETEMSCDQEGPPTYLRYETYRHLSPS